MAGIEALLRTMGLATPFVYDDALTKQSDRVVDVVVEAVELDELFVNLLDEVLYLFSAEFVLPTGCSTPTIIRERSCYRLCTQISATPYTPEVHGVARDVKAVTYHMLSVDITPARTRIKVLFDL